MTCRGSSSECDAGSLNEMSSHLYDAHIHLADPRLSQEIDTILSTYQVIGLNKAIVVATSPEDWDAVLTICQMSHCLIPALGLHPWKVNHAPRDWAEQLDQHLDNGLGLIGEIGLDQWIPGHEIGKQLEAFRWQFSLAAQRNLPTSIHCLKAHEPLLEALRSLELPARGFKLHAYNGPRETLAPLLEMGAYFSFNAGQLKPGAKKLRELIRLVPRDRILVETDAPEFLPPAEYREFSLKAICNDAALPPGNHPANIRAAYRGIAAIRGEQIEPFAENVARNFVRYFLQEPPTSQATYSTMAARRL